MANPGETDLGAEQGLTPARTMRAAVIGFVILMVDGYDSLMAGNIAPLLAHEWHLQPADIGKLFAICYLGAILGAVSMGPLADRFGRRPMLLWALALAAVATALCAVAPNFPALCLFRFLAGIALGGALPAVSSLTAEHAKRGTRNGTVTLTFIGYPMGAVVGGAITAGALQHGWRAIFWGTFLCCVVAFCIAWLLPETYRARRGLVEGSLARRLRVGFTEQFEDGRLMPALALWLSLFCLMLLVYFLVNWSPSILVASGSAPAIAALAPVFLNLGGIVGALGLAPAINRFGPYRPVAILAGVGAFVIAALGLDHQAVGLTMVLLFIAGIAIMGGQLNFPAMTVDLYPQHVRGAGAGWTIGMGRVGSIVGPLLGGSLIGAGFGLQSLFLVATVPALLAAVALAAIHIRQRGRRA